MFADFKTFRLYLTRDQIAVCSQPTDNASACAIVARQVADQIAQIPRADILAPLAECDMWEPADLEAADDAELGARLVYVAAAGLALELELGLA
ncbi:MAG: hypothetical protein KGL39_38285 [Patescibacteria group bacterium]|nr:hypothetical protein [Patescibacteria group bacterium]